MLHTVLFSTVHSTTSCHAKGRTITDLGGPPGREFMLSFFFLANRQLSFFFPGQPAVEFFFQVVQLSFFFLPGC